MRSIPVILLFLCSFLPDSLLNAQTDEYKYYYRVYFTDKGANSPQAFSPDMILSQKAIDRRIKAGVDFPDYRDLPVFREYIDQITGLGFTLHCTSKWLNTALFKTKNETGISQILALPFVLSVKMVKRPAGKSQFIDKLDLPVINADTPPYDRPITMVNGYPLHLSGYDGTNILIAVLDGGFTFADKATSLSRLRNRGGIKYTYDFVNKNRFVYSYHTHGTAVLSILAGQIPGAIAGTAPSANFLLLRTEDGNSEFPVEEDFWAAGAEFADSAGADIISSSLGYYKFDAPEMDHSFSELDGNTTFVSRAADVAASKGILVVCSAGNERNKPWQRIIAPSDGDSVLASAAVDGNNIISSFSSAGPSADGQVKPDLSTMGVTIVVQMSESDLIRSNGTSFSCPVLSGMTACLLEAVPEADNMEIINALHQSADRANAPDSLYGYGIPDMTKALEILQDNHLLMPDNELAVTPNPTDGEFELIFRQPPESLNIEIAASSGRILYRNNFREYAGRNLRITALNNMEDGIYFMKISTESRTFTKKILLLHSR